MFKNFFSSYYDLALNTYHVNPIVFLIIYLVSIPIFYISLFCVIKGLAKIRKEKGAGRGAVLNRNFLFWLTTLVLVFLAPYIYVLTFGRNLPSYIWFSIAVIIGVSIIMLWLKIWKSTIKKRLRNEKMIWKIYSYCYDGLLGLRPYKSLIEKMLYESSLETGENVLDIGVGTGNFEDLNKVSGINFTCLDFSEHMMNRAIKKNPEYTYGIYNVNDCKIPAENDIFDKVVSSNVIYNVKDLGAFFQDVNRVLKPGGQLIFTTSIKSGLLPIVREHFRESCFRDNALLLLRLPSILTILIINLIIDNSGDYYFYPEEMLERAVTTAGFEIVRKRRIFGELNTLIVAKKAD